MEICKYEGDLKEMMLLIKQHEKALKDNGHPGLITNVTDIKHTVENLLRLYEDRECKDEEFKAELEGIRKALSGLVKAHEDLERWRDEKDKKDLEVLTTAEKAVTAAKDKAELSIKKGNFIVYLILSGFLIANILINLFMP